MIIVLVLVAVVLRRRTRQPRPSQTAPATTVTQVAYGNTVRPIYVPESTQSVTDNSHAKAPHVYGELQRHGTKQLPVEAEQPQYDALRRDDPSAPAGGEMYMAMSRPADAAIYQNQLDDGYLNVGAEAAPEQQAYGSLAAGYGFGEAADMQYDALQRPRAVAGYVNVPRDRPETVYQPPTTLLGS